MHFFLQNFSRRHKEAGLITKYILASCLSGMFGRKDKIKTGWTVNETGKDRLRNFSVVESRPRGNLLISTLFETKPRPTSCTDASRNQSPCTSLTLPKRNLDVLSRQSTSLSRSLVESEQKRQEITKSVMEQSIAEFAKGIQ